VFCTANDEYVVDAMARGGIDYLLKPVRDDELARALARYDRLEAQFAARLAAVSRALAAPQRRRVLARWKDGFVAVDLGEVAYFTLDDRLVDVVTRDGRRLGVDRTLGDLEAELGAGDFFRVNRQYLVHASAVRGFRPLWKGKLAVELAPAPAGDVVVSQDNAARFRAWLGG
jgi:two-component system LytT family response regulator